MTIRKTTTFRVLGIHGSGGNGVQFAKILERWGQHWENDWNWIVTTVSGPVTTTIPNTHNTEDARVWWRLPDGVRSYQATTYECMEQSEKIVLDAIAGETKITTGSVQTFSRSPDIIVAHSQGAILMTALLAQNKINNHPSIGYIFNGVAWPNPYTQQLETLTLSNTTSCTATTTTTNLTYPRILFLVGTNDTINPPEQAERVQCALEKAGYNVTTLRHSGGHSIPQAPDVLQKIYQWILMIG